MNFHFYIYPFFVGVAWGLAILYLKEKIKDLFLRPKFIALLSFIFISAWVGSKLMFLWFSVENPTLYFSSSDFWLGGGFVFYGGLFASLLTVLIFYKLQIIPDRQLVYLAPATSLGHAIGRLGCFFAGCCYGKEISFLGLVGKFPVQLLEAFGLFLLFRVLNRSADRGKSFIYLLYQYLLSYAFLRFITEFFRGDFGRGDFFDLGIGPGQALSLIIILLLTMYWLIHRMFGLTKLR